MAHRRGRTRDRERERGSKRASGLRGKPQTMKATRSIVCPGARETVVNSRTEVDSNSGMAGRESEGIVRGWESEREGCFRAGRYSRKSRERAEWRENSWMRIYRRARDLNGETERVVFIPLSVCLPTLLRHFASRTIPPASRLVTLCSLWH